MFPRIPNTSVLLSCQVSGDSHGVFTPESLLPSPVHGTEQEISPDDLRLPANSGGQSCPS